MNTDILYPQESYNIVGAIIEVHKRLGCGFLEKVYQEALAVEFQVRGIPYEREKHLAIQYRDRMLDTDYMADFVCYDKINVELKAVENLTDVHRAQVMNYLKMSNMRLGLLVNFNVDFIRPQRIVM